MNSKNTLLLSLILLTFFSACNKSLNYYYPPPGNDISNQDQRTPEEVGLNPKVVNEINLFLHQNKYVRNGNIYPIRWALWRDGHLIHVEGDFYKKSDVASLRKTWHAMIVGAALKNGKIKSLNQKLTDYLNLTGNDAQATWKDILTQSAGFDYPYGSYPDYKPGEMWTYSDLNLINLCNAIAHVYGKKNYFDHYDEIASETYFDDIGMRGWATAIKKDQSFGNRNDGVRFVLNLEHMGRLGLLALSRGQWNGEQLIDKTFVEALETKQTYGMKVNYNGPNDGVVGYSENEFPESPYGYLTWVNTDGDLYKDADKYWANGSGAGGSKILWNKNNGIVFAGFGINMVSDTTNLPLIIENNLEHKNPLLAQKPIPKVGRWSYYELCISKIIKTKHPYNVKMVSKFTDPNNKVTVVSGFYDGNNRWKVRFMPYEWMLDGKIKDITQSGMENLISLESTFAAYNSAYSDSIIKFH
ncbi:MAG TPA: DUF5060 domain-containing protein [Draconibacterium sp.]|nr:DUF5060 domain-containing protein [Draconibacterium sp.]